MGGNVPTFSLLNCLFHQPQPHTTVYRLDPLLLCRRYIHAPEIWRETHIFEDFLFLHVPNWKYPKSVTIRITTYMEIINSTCVFIVWHSLSNSETGKFVPVGFESVEHDARSQCPHLFPSELPFLSTSTAHHCFLSGSSIVVQVLYSFPRNLKGKMHFSGLLVPPLSWWYKNHLHVRSN